MRSGLPEMQRSNSRASEKYSVPFSKDWERPELEVITVETSIKKTNALGTALTNEGLSWG
jgi:hypothetical protein